MPKQHKTIWEVIEMYKKIDKDWFKNPPTYLQVFEKYGYLYSPEEMRLISLEIPCKKGRKVLIRNRLFKLFGNNQEYFVIQLIIDMVTEAEELDEMNILLRRCIGKSLYYEQYIHSVLDLDESFMPYGSINKKYFYVSFRIFLTSNQEKNKSLSYTNAKSLLEKHFKTFFHYSQIDAWQYRLCDNYPHWKDEKVWIHTPEERRQEILELNKHLSKIEKRLLKYIVETDEAIKICLDFYKQSRTIFEQIYEDLLHCGEEILDHKEKLEKNIEKYERETEKLQYTKVKKI